MYKPGGTGDKEKGSHSFIGPERVDRSDWALVLTFVLTLGSLSAQSCLGTLVVIPSPQTKNYGLLLPFMFC